MTASYLPSHNPYTQQGAAVVRPFLWGQLQRPRTGRTHRSPVYTGPAAFTVNYLVNLRTEGAILAGLRPLRSGRRSRFYMPRLLAVLLVLALGVLDRAFAPGTTPEAPVAPIPHPPSRTGSSTLGRRRPHGPCIRHQGRMMAGEDLGGRRARPQQPSQLHGSRTAGQPIRHFLAPRRPSRRLLHDLSSPMQALGTGHHHGIVAAPRHSCLVTGPAITTPERSLR